MTVMVVAVAFGVVVIEAFLIWSLIQSYGIQSMAAKVTVNHMIII